MKKNSERKIIVTPDKYTTKRSSLKRIDKENDYQTTPYINYFRIMKEIEKEEEASKQKIKRTSKPAYDNLTEKIYLNNSSQLGNYYDENKSELFLYGSKRYEFLTIKNLVKEMGKYKNKVIAKIKENKKNTNVLKNYNFESCDEKVILTPLAENDKEKNEMIKLEKKKFDEAERCAVVMRRIEYVHLLDDRESTELRDSFQEDKNIISYMENSVKKQEKNPLRYKNNKNKKENKDIKDKEENKDIYDNKNGDKIINKEINNNIDDNNEINNNDDGNWEHFYSQLTCNKKAKRINKSKRCFITKLYKEFNESEKNKNLLHIKELENKYNEVNNNLIETKNKLDSLYVENKRLQLLLEDSNQSNQDLNNKCKFKNELNKKCQNDNEELLKNYNDINNKYNKTMNDYSTLNQTYNSLLIERNNLKNDYDSLIKNNNILNTKYKEILEDYKTKTNELDNIKNNYQIILKLNNQNKKKVDELSGTIEDINKEKNDYITKNKLLLDQITNLDGEIDNFKKNKTLEEKENENKFKELNDNYLKEKNYLTNIVNDKDKEILNQKTIIDNYKSKCNDLELLKNKLIEVNQQKDEKEDEIKKIKIDLYQKINQNNEYENEINNLKNRRINNDEINQNKINEYEKKIEIFKKKISLLEKEKEDLKKTTNILENLVNENKDKYIKLFNQYKNDVNNLNKKNEDLNNDLDKLKKELNDINNKTKNDCEKKYKNDLEEMSNKYEKKINKLNKVIEELKNRIQTLYLELSNIQRNNANISRNQDIETKIKLMTLLIQKYIDKNIIFDKRKFFNLLLNKNNDVIEKMNHSYDDSMKKLYKSKSKEKKIEYLRDSYKNNHPY